MADLDYAFALSSPPTASWLAGHSPNPVIPMPLSPGVASDSRTYMYLNQQERPPPVAETFDNLLVTCAAIEQHLSQCSSCNAKYTSHDFTLMGNRISGHVMSTIMFLIACVAGLILFEFAIRLGRATSGK